MVARLLGEVLAVVCPCVFLASFWRQVSLFHISCYCVAVCPRHLLFFGVGWPGVMPRTTSKRAAGGDGSNRVRDGNSTVVRSFAKLEKRRRGYWESVEGVEPDD